MPIALGFKLLSLLGLSAPAARRFAPLALIGIVLAVLALIVVAFNLWLGGREKAAVEADRSASRAEAVSRAREADERATAASGATREGIEATNAEARAAAAQSDDPLRAGLDKLREGR